MPATPRSNPITGPEPSRNVKARKKRIAKTIAETTLIPSQSATRRSPGLPAIASRFCVVCVNDAEVKREMLSDRWPASGLIVRSKNGCWSSISSRFLACMVPSWVSRAWTGSTAEPPASPSATRMMASAAAAAMTTGRSGPIALDLDVHDFPNEHEADEHHRQAHTDQDDARRDDEQESGQADRQERHHRAGDSLLGGERADLAFDPHPLADRVCDRVQDLREVAAHLVLDGDRRRHQVQVLGLDTPNHVLQGLLEREPKVDFADDALELRGDRRPRLADHQLDGLEERRARPERVSEQRDRVRQLLVERVEPPSLSPLDVEARQEEANDRADEEDDRVVQGREEEPEDEHSHGDPDDRAGPDEEVLADLELQVRAGELAGEVRPEVALLHDPVERGDRGRLRDQVADRSLAGGRRLGRVLALRSVALQARGDVGSAAGRRDAQGDEQDRERRDCGDEDRRRHDGASRPAP